METLRASLSKSIDYLPEKHQEQVFRAFDLANEAHEGMRRRSGEPYITHPGAVTTILAERRMDVDALAARLLHDTVDDTDVTSEQSQAEPSAAGRRMVA